VIRLFARNPFQVNLLRADAIMANDTPVRFLSWPTGWASSL
jgi:hypothetical protein